MYGMLDNYQGKLEKVSIDNVHDFFKKVQNPGTRFKDDVFLISGLIESVNKFKERPCVIAASGCVILYRLIEGEWQEYVNLNQLEKTLDDTVGRLKYSSNKADYRWYVS